VWPEFILYDEVGIANVEHKLTTFGHLSIYICNENDELVAHGYGIAISWDGSLEALPAGWDGAVIQAMGNLRV
jgi:hypothetical protein